jgi:predicted DNA-binding transcriptional regulator AlpA
MSGQKRLIQEFSKAEIEAIVNDPKLDRDQAASRAGIGVKTMERKIRAETFPPPGYLGRKPFWLQFAVDHWGARQMASCAAFGKAP